MYCVEAFSVRCTGRPLNYTAEEYEPLLDMLEAMPKVHPKPLSLLARKLDPEHQAEFSS